MNITWEEIRDIIEEEIYIGSGTTLGVSDAAKAIKARIEAVEQGLHPTGGALSNQGSWYSPEDMPTPNVNLVPPTSG